jgi:NRPS condensation-like uncharacterized protein
MNVLSDIVGGPAAGTTLPAEYFDELTQVSAEFGPIGYIYILLDYSAPLDPERLGVAMRRLIDAEPVLGCRFDDSGDKPIWRRRDDLDQVAACPLAISANIEADTAAWLSDRFNTRTSANVGSALLRAANGTGDRLLLRFSHVAGDGAAALNAVAALTDLYSRLAKEPEYRPTPNTASRDSFRWLEDFSRKDRRKLFLRELSSLPRALKPHRGLRLEDATTFLADLATVTPAYRILRLGSDRLAAIDQYSRARRVTLNEVLLAAFVRAFDEFCPSPADTDIAVGLPADLRRYAPLQRRPAFANLTGGFTVRVRPTAGEPFERTLAGVQQEMQRHRSRYLGTEGQLYHWWLARISFARKRRLMQRQALRYPGKPLAPALTNLGGVKARRFACDTSAPRDVATLTLAAPFPLFAMSAVRMDNRLALGICFDLRFGIRRIEAFMRRLDRDMPGYCSCPAAQVSSMEGA